MSSARHVNGKAKLTTSTHGDTLMLKGPDWDWQNALKRKYYLSDYTNTCDWPEYRHLYGEGKAVSSKAKEWLGGYVRYASTKPRERTGLKKRTGENKYDLCTGHLENNFLIWRKPQ